MNHLEFQVGQIVKHRVNGIRILIICPAENLISRGYVGRYYIDGIGENVGFHTDNFYEFELEEE